ncbi:hypothetical protein ACFS6H_12000 [Terrimonas rubra]|uniref:Right handed beta helix region n=1 Tax=Terrimonas rubra TaxID=1035890 RepID=A0ABW6A5N9_9BACT
MKYLVLLTLTIFTYTASQAKSWRINNNVGVQADFTTFYDAAQAAAVANGDTLYIEPSANVYATNSITLTKRLVVLGVGYFLNPANTTYPGNSGLQETKDASQLAFFRIGEGANGSYFAGIIFSGLNLSGSAADFNLTLERNLFVGTLLFEAGNNNKVTVKKNFFLSCSISNNGGAVSIADFTCENNIFYDFWAAINLTQLTGSNNIVRNNSIYGAGAGSTIVNCYVANNIFGTNGALVFTNSTVKNNIFTGNPSLPATASNNLVGQSSDNVYGAHVNTTSPDMNVMIPSSSPAKGAGLTVGTVVSPDCGAFGATDPYRLSGIPAIPTIYTLSVPTSIPSGSATMNITLSTRNNN